MSARPIVPLGEIARQNMVSIAAVVSTARRLGIEIDRSPTLRKRVTPAEADLITAALNPDQGAGAAASAGA
jgi:hypothetical protein